MLDKKKGAIGATLTWVVATIIILFVIIIFLIASGTLKPLLNIGGVLQPVMIEPLKLPEQQQSLYAIVKTPSPLGLSIEELIVNGRHEEVKNVVNPILEKLSKNKWWEEHSGYKLFYWIGSWSLRKEVITKGDLTDVQQFYLALTKNPEIKLKFQLDCKNGWCGNNFEFLK